MSQWTYEKMGGRRDFAVSLLKLGGVELTQCILEYGRLCEFAGQMRRARFRALTLLIRRSSVSI